jgi:hypothetical protein
VSEADVFAAAFAYAAKVHHGRGSVLHFALGAPDSESPPRRIPLGVDEEK